MEAVTRAQSAKGKVVEVMTGARDGRPRRPEVVHSSWAPPARRLARDQAPAEIAVAPEQIRNPDDGFVTRLCDFRTAVDPTGYFFPG